ncbi:MAG TPA: gluconate 2-dehydrogenase subunit 3 family protein [Bryobacteraceae bacterium]|nr:gluconate 2-dehydrogenase subunit 3 family protein [Bryobacteraceae bacterium]
MAIERRNLFKILGASVAIPGVGLGQPQHKHTSTARASATYQPRALTPPEYRVVDKLTDLILPADEKSPGAHDAGVARYIDIVLLYGDKTTLSAWQNGVKQLDAAAAAAHGRLFVEITLEQQTDIMRLMAANEANPITEMETFFAAVKRLAIEAYYLSSAGKQSLGYKGDKAISRFPGCTHQDHQV